MDVEERREEAFRYSTTVMVDENPSETVVVASRIFNVNE